MRIMVTKPDGTIVWFTDIRNGINIWEGSQEEAIYEAEIRTKAYGPDGYMAKGFTYDIIKGA